MADTIRSRDEIITLFADNAPAKAINAQRARDLIVSSMPIVKAVSQLFTTVADDDDFYFPLTANKLYTLDLTLFVYVVNGSPSLTISSAPSVNFNIFSSGYGGIPASSMTTSTITDFGTLIKIYGWINNAFGSDDIFHIRFAATGGPGAEISVMQGSIMYVHEIGDAEGFA